MSDAQESLVVVGGGLAGAQFASALRDQGWKGGITVVCGECEAPYHRPPLSKAYLEGTATEASLQLRSAAHYDQRAVNLVTGAQVQSIDRTARSLSLSNGQTLHWSRLVLATGARNRDLPGCGSSPDILYLRTKADAEVLKQRAASSRSIIVVGGGFLGLEVAHSLRKQGKDVTVLEAAGRLLARASSPEISAALLAMHLGHGVKVRLVASIARVCEGEDGVQVTLNSGESLAADLVVVSIGVVPNTELAEQAGLAVSNGIVVDEFLATSDPAIFAIGDCATFPSAFAKGPLRLESVQNANDQARCLAFSLAAGQARAYNVLPWFWSDQGLKLQIAGLVSRAERFWVKNNTAESFSVYGFRDDHLVSVESLGSPADHLAARKLLADGRAVHYDEVVGKDPAIERFAAA